MDDAVAGKSESDVAAIRAVAAAPASQATTQAAFLMKRGPASRTPGRRLWPERLRCRAGDDDGIAGRLTPRTRDGGRGDPAVGEVAREHASGSREAGGVVATGPPGVTISDRF